MECTPCPSCRLAVSSSTGRLRWCVAEKGGQRRVRWVLTASVLLLALATVAAVLVLRLARVCVENDASDVEADPGVTSTSANRNRALDRFETEGEEARERGPLTDYELGALKTPLKTHWQT
ncbi:uncharacterized protein LOC127752333 [Frankliniella occidentalis]|uniref:Uncharacterized protein LOC127752333 n=1 Tax=Frankliniella occidentalis TaxID=133901 RepID=A0A9C6XDH4_FRAOC|nr:uncharacterized protein LOC127752333 [Frankliniella occidentalis]